jgi:acyl carrier protein
VNTEAARAHVQAVLGRIAPEVDLADVPGDVDFREEIDLDSMDFLSLVEGLKDATGVDVPEEDYDSIETLDGLVAYLAAKAA